MPTLCIDGNETRALDEACGVLSRGGLIALPTETVYGLAADATSGAALARVFDAKGRPRFNPLICHMDGLAMARRHAVFDAVGERLAEAFWPGPLTLVLPAAGEPAIHPLAGAGLATLAVRVPSGFARTLIGRYGRPLAAPSANSSGKLSPATAAHVAADLGDKVDLILDGGPAAIGIESTIVKPTDDGVVLLRPGGLDIDDIARIAGAPVRRAHARAAVEAPGAMRSHYAPGARVVMNATEAVPGAAVVTFGGHVLPGAELAVRVLDLSPAGDVREAAAGLFDTLRRADAAANGVICVAPIPRTGLGEAINDRLERAAAPRQA